MRRVLETSDIVLKFCFFCVFLYFFGSVDYMCLKLIGVGGGACNTVVGLELELIYMYPLALHLVEFSCHQCQK